MSVISRGSLPQNFLDSASTGMRLPTPQPQYFFAKMAMASRLSLAALDAGVATVQQFVTSAGGGAQLPPELDEMARAADAYPEAVKAFDAFGKDAGDTIKMYRDVYGGGGNSESQRQLNTEASISTTGQAIQAEEIPVVLKEYHGPWNSAAGQVRPYAIWQFDAKYRKNKEQLTSKTTRYLRQDYVGWLERVVRNRFIGGSANGTDTTVGNVTLPGSLANATQFVAGGTDYISLEQVLRGRKALSDREWAKFSNGRYMCLVPTAFNTQMIGDVDYRELSKVHREGRNQLFGYIGSIQDVDFFEVSTLATYASTGADFTTVNGSAVPAGVNLAEGLLFGPGVVGFGTAISDQQGSVGPEVRFADDTNYGTVAKMIWYALHAFQTLDERGVQRLLFQV